MSDPMTISTRMLSIDVILEIVHKCPLRTRNGVLVHLEVVPIACTVLATSDPNETANRKSWLDDGLEVAVDAVGDLGSLQVSVSTKVDRPPRYAGSG